MVVTLFGISIEVKPEQPAKAAKPIVVILLGISIEVMPVVPSKAAYPIAVTELGISVFLHAVMIVLLFVLMIALQLSRESYTGLSLATIIDVKLGHSPKTSRPIEVTFFGI